MTILLALALLQAAPELPAQIDEIFRDPTCARVDELRRVYLELERQTGAGASPLQPQRHRQIAVFLAACSSAPPPPQPPIQTNCPAITLSFLGNTSTFLNELEVSRAINTVLALSGLPIFREHASEELRAALRDVMRVFHVVQAQRTAAVFGDGWGEKRDTIAAKADYARTPAEASFVETLKRWYSDDFLP